MTPLPFLDVLPATQDLVGAGLELVDRRERETVLRRALAPVKGSYEFILIDCPPSLGLITLNVLTAADGSSSRFSASTTRWRGSRSCSTPSISCSRISIPLSRSMACSSRCTIRGSISVGRWRPMRRSTSVPRCFRR
jgi:hypothetical protein